MVLQFGLRNAVATISHLVARLMVLPLMNSEFMGVIEHIIESLHNLLAEEPESSSGSNSSRGSHHPPWEYFMAETPEGHVESVSADAATPAGNLGDGTKGRTVAPSHVGVEQLKAQKREINEAGQQLVREYVEVDRERVGAHAPWPVM